MSVLDVADVAFGYAGDALFREVGFRLNAGERAALVAPNGAGKTTLLRIIAGELAADRGSVVLAKDARLAFYRQSHELRASGTLLEALSGSFSEIVALRAELRDAEHRAASGRPEDLERLATLTDRFEHAGGNDLDRRIETIATRLGFGHADLSRPVASLSGGERGRLLLGIVLASEAELLLLDEPTNHLDLDTIRWLEGWLCASRSAALIVSHDRAFLDAVCPATFELGRRTFRTYPLGWSAYHEARAEDLERERAAFEQQAEFVEKTEEFIRKNIAGQKTKQAQSRRKMLEKLERSERPEDVWQVAGRVGFRFAEAPRTGDVVLDARGLQAGRGGRTLFEGVDLLVHRADRIGVVGANGCGKTTFLRLLAGQGGDDDRGEVRRGTHLRDGYFDQHLGSLDPEPSLVETIRAVRGDLSVDATRSYLARFRFWGDDPFRSVSSLSGGERSRLALAKLLLEPRNLLFLDEPTNHLDIPAAEILEEALCDFPGTVIFVSHDRRFLETVSTRTVAFTKAGVDVYEGGFRDFGEMLERQRRAEAERGRRPVKKPEASDGAARFEARQKASREVEKRRRRLQELEESIAQSESALSSLRETLRNAPGDEWEKVCALAAEEQTLAKKVSRLMDEWTQLSEQVAADAAAAQGAAS